MRTTAAVLRERGGAFTWEDVELDDLRPGELRVRMVAVGLCHTDLSVRTQDIPLPLPAVLGHEGAGVVEEVGSEVTAARPGDHVLLSFTSCGECGNCRAERPAYCDHFLQRNVFDGARPDGTSPMSHEGMALTAHFFGQSSLARHAVVDQRCVVRVDPEAPLDVLAPLGCGVQTGAGAVLNVLAPEAGDSLAVFGVGGVGISAVMAAKTLGVKRVIAVDRDPGRLALARELGAHATVTAGEVDTVAAVREATRGRGVDHALECVGAGSVVAEAVDSLAPYGTAAVVGAPPAGTTFEVDVHHLLNGRRIVGVTEGGSVPHAFIPRLIELYERGALPLERIIRHYPWTDVEQAVADMESGTAIKPVLRFS